MEKQEILAVVNELVEKVTEREIKVTEDAYVQTTQAKAGEVSLDLSSLELVQFIMMLEERFSITVTSDEIGHLNKVKDIIEFVQYELTAEEHRKEEIESASAEIFGV